MKKKKIIVVGAGPVGCLLALLLAKKDFAVELFDKRDFHRPSAGSAQRAINMAVSFRGWKALRRIGVEDQLKAMTLPMYGRMVHHRQGNCDFQRYDDDHNAIFSVSRQVLNEFLSDKVQDDDGIRFYPQHECLDIDIDAAKLNYLDKRTGRSGTSTGDVVIGADGAHSRIRTAIDTEESVHSPLSFSTHSYMELSLPKGKLSASLASGSLHIWPRGQHMMIALPNPDGSFNCTLFLPAAGPDSFAALSTTRLFQEFFAVHYTDMLQLPSLDEVGIISGKPSRLATMQAEKWHSKGKAIILGDAAHAILPFFGQGMNAGFEDCCILEDLIDSGSDWVTIATEFEKCRKPDARAIASLSNHNFIEMSQKVADDQYLLRKKVEEHIRKRYPDSWHSLYSMVTFSDIPYSKAQAIAARQDNILDQVMEIQDVEESIRHIDLHSFIHEATFAH